ncbi:MAG: hypothetical protein AAB403_09095 [Planctomycetota bacterium]
MGLLYQYQISGTLGRQPRLGSVSTIAILAMLALANIRPHRGAIATYRRCELQCAG